MLGNDDFVVVWEEEYGNNIDGQRFDSGGGAIGTEFIVSAYTSDEPDPPTSPRWTAAASW